MPDSTYSYEYKDRPKNYPYLTTTREKKAHDHKLAKDMFDFYDMSMTVTAEEKERIIENLNLHVGRWPKMADMPGINFSAGGEPVELGGGKLEHWPLIDRLSTGAIAEIILQPLVAIVKDTSHKAANMRRKMRLDRIREWANTRFIEPAQERAREKVLTELGIKDPNELGPEEQEQFKQAIDNEVKNNIGDDIVESLKRTRTPGEIVFQAFLDDFVVRDKVKNKLDTGGEFAITNAKEYYMVRPGLREPIFKVLPIDAVSTYRSQDVDFPEDGVAAKVEMFITPEDLVANYGHILKRSDIDKLLSGFTPGGGGTSMSSSEYRRGIESEALEMIMYNPELNNNFNIKTEEGQDMLKYVYSRIPSFGGTSSSIRETYITFKWTRRGHRVLRKDPETGKEEILFRDEHYVKNPLAGDIVVEQTLFPQVWHGVRLGIGENKVWAFIEPVKDQYQDVDNPFKVKLTIFGCEHGAPMNKVKPVSHIDRAKPWNWRYNVLMKRLDIHESTDFGRVLLGTANMKPPGWSYTEFFQSILFGKFGLVRSTAEGLSPADMQVLREVNLGSAGDIASILDRLSYIEQRATASFYETPASMGQISPYATNRNTQQAVAGAQKSMVRFHERRRQVKENVLNALCRCFITTYKDNEKVKARLLDEYGQAYFETMVEDLDSFYTIQVVEDYRESEKLQEMRSMMLSIMQNGGTTRQIAAIVDASNMAEIIEISEKFDREQIMRQQEQQASQERMFKMAEDAKTQRDQADKAFQMDWRTMAEETKRYMADQQAMMLQNANDVNRDGQNDNLERDLMKLGMEEEKLAEMTRLKEKEMELRYGGRKV